MIMGLMDMLVFPGESASWDCQVQSTTPLQFMWYRNGMLVQNTAGSLMGGNTTSSSYMLTNVSYDYNASNVTCSATGSVLTVNSSEAAYLTGKSLWLIFRAQKYAYVYFCWIRYYSQAHIHTHEHTYAWTQHIHIHATCTHPHMGTNVCIHIYVHCWNNSWPLAIFRPISAFG